MSLGKKWKMTKKQMHKNQKRPGWMKDHVEGGKKGHPGFKCFRFKVKFIDSSSIINKIMAKEKRHWSI